MVNRILVTATFIISFFPFFGEGKAQSDEDLARIVRDTPTMFRKCMENNGRSIAGQLHTAKMMGRDISALLLYRCDHMIMGYVMSCERLRMDTNQCYADLRREYEAVAATY